MSCRLTPFHWRLLGATVCAVIHMAVPRITYPASIFLASPGAVDSDRVVEFDSNTGTVVREFIYEAAPHDWTPTGIVLGPDGILYVASQTRQQTDGAEIIRIDLSTGTPSVFATTGISGIFGITIGPNGNIFASSACGPGSPGCGPDAPKVVEYDGVTGQLIGTFVGGLLPAAGAIAFGPNGNLFIGGDGDVVEYDGSTGALVGTFASHGLSSAVNSLAFAPDGNLVVADTGVGIMEFQGTTGDFIRFIDARPRFVGVAFDANGYLIASVNEQHEPVLQYAWPSGKLVGTYAAPTGFPHGIASDRGAPNKLTSFRRGDSNSDGAINISDALATLGYLFLGDKLIPCEQAGDANADGVLDIADAVTVLSFLFLGADAIEPPLTICGTDPAVPTLPCEAFPGCT